MQKLKLEIESLRVDSFSTERERTASRATVHGYEVTDYNTFWCTAPSSVGPNVCHETDALGCPQKPKAEFGIAPPT